MHNSTVALQNRIKELETALIPFSNMANSWVIQTAARRQELVTVSNGDRMCGIPAEAFTKADAVLKKGI